MAAGTTGVVVVVFLAVVALVPEVYGLEKTGSQGGKGCDLYQGKWVHDASYPLYNTTACPFVNPDFDCQNNGRPDQLYLKYRWQPSSCNLPKFDGKEFLTRVKGKRLMLVGDSLSYNQWLSLNCMIHGSVPEAKYTLTPSPRFGVGGVSFMVEFPEYNVSIIFARNTLLVDIFPEKIGRVLDVNSISQGESWKGMDVLIFNSWHWWVHKGSQQPWDMIRDGNHIYKDMDRLVLYHKALNTWARWVESDIDPAKTKVLFQGISPEHSNSRDWGNATAKDCTGETQPFSGPKYPAGTPPAEAIVEGVLRHIKKPVQLLNVTGLSQLRKDGHPSKYGDRQQDTRDCSHWCLPGVPDTWNELLFAALL